MSYHKFFNELKIPLKETSITFKVIFESIAKEFEEFKRYAEKIVDEHYTKISDDIDLFALDRGITQLKNEDKGVYRERVVKAYSFYKNSSTLQGIKNILSTVLDVDDSSSDKEKYTISELYREDWILGQEPIGWINLEKDTEAVLGNEKTLFYFIVKIENRIFEYERVYLDELIETYKPAYMGYHLDVKIHLDEWKLDGSKLLGITTHAVVTGEG